MGVILYSAAAATGVPSDVAKGIGSLPLLAVKSLYELLEQRAGRQKISSSRPDALPTMQEFLLSPVFLALSSYTMFVGAMWLTGGMMYILVEMSASFIVNDVTAAHVAAISAPMTALPIRVIAFAQIGGWIGSRSRRHTYLLAVGAALFALCTTAVVSIYLNAADALIPLIQAVDLPGSSRHAQLLVLMIPDYVLLLASAMLGTWLGTRRVFVRYMNFILMVLTPEARTAIAELAREEAVRTTTPPSEVLVPGGR